MEREKQEIREKINDVKNRIEAYSAKVKLAQDEQANVEGEKLRKKKTDLLEKTSTDLKALHQ